MGRRSIVAIVALGCIATFTPATPAAAASVGYGSAVRIVLERSGGFAGRSDSFVVDRSTVGGRQPLRMAESFDFMRLRGRYLPADPCCDRYSYRLAVSYRGGYRKTVATVQGTDAPRVLWNVIAETERVGVRPLPAA